MDIEKSINAIGIFLEVWDLEQADSYMPMNVFENDIKAFKLAIKSLEKQVPIKPNLVTYVPLKSVGWKYCCPSCNYAVGINSNSFDYTEEDNYCGGCGQKLDWKL